MSIIILDKFTDFGFYQKSFKSKIYISFNTRKMRNEIRLSNLIK